MSVSDHTADVAHGRLRAQVIRDRVEPAASPAMSAMPPKAEANSGHQRRSDGLLRLDRAAVDMIQAPKRELEIQVQNGSLESCAKIKGARRFGAMTNDRDRLPQPITWPHAPGIA